MNREEPKFNPECRAAKSAAGLVAERILETE
jgi:hypothetical protein